MKKLRKWLKRLALFAIASLLLVMAVGYVFNNSATNRFLSEHPALGQLIDVGGHKLHCRVIGDAGPVVVCDAGVSQGGTYTCPYQDELAEFSKVCTYDRAGYAWSEAGPLPRSCFQNIEELRTLLKKVNLSPPYILVGESLGGANCRLFASLYPDEVAGLVLVDALVPDVIPPEDMEAMPGAFFTLLDTTRHFGAIRAVQGLRSTRETGIQTPELRAVVELANQWRCVPRHFHTLVNEIRGTANSPELVPSFRHLGNLPVTVITATGYDSPFHYWGEGQESLKRISNNTRIVEVDCGHWVSVERPDVVVDAVSEIIERINSAKTPSRQ